MSAVEPAKERIERQLQEAIERLRADLDRVEFWAERARRLRAADPGLPASDDLTRHLLRRSRGGKPRDAIEPPAERSASRRH